MRVVLLGAGNLATSLAHALVKAGHDIPAVFSRTMQSAKTLADRLNLMPTDDISTLPSDADIYIVAVKDDVITDVTARLSGLRPDALIAHTAGTVSIDAVKAGRRGVFYPMQTFSRQRIVDFQHIPLFVEADNPDDEALMLELASSISGNVMPLDGEKRKVLHLAAVFCCNFANHCSSIAEYILAQNGIPFNVMLPLINETTQKLNQCSPREAQTGPAIRHDQNVINNHIQVLQNNGLHQLADIYKAMTESIQSLPADSRD